MRSTRLSPPGLRAGLQAVLGGLRGEAARRVFESADRLTAPPTPVLVVLASNLPALAAQSLLPALALRRPTLLKSPSAEPVFAPALVRALAQREPVLGRTLAALSWRGGDEVLETPLLQQVGRVLAYGDAKALADLERRAPGKVHPYGPKTSIAILTPDSGSSGPGSSGSGSGESSRATVEGLAQDIALFDQRGCLSITSIFTTGDPRSLAKGLAKALEETRNRLPPGPADLTDLAAVRHLRSTSTMAGLYQPELPLAAGTVVVAARPVLEPSPGLRTVQVLPIREPAEAILALRPWAGRIQGVALAGETLRAARADTLKQSLLTLGVSRFAIPGELQSPDASWHNGGEAPLQLLTNT